MYPNDQRTKRLRTVILVTALLLLAIAFLFWWLYRGTEKHGNVSGSGDTIGIGTFNEDTPGGVEKPKPDSVFGGFAETTTTNGRKPRFRLLVKEPTAGAIALPDVAKTRSVRYVLAENGHIADVDIDSGASAIVSNTTFARGVHEAFFLDEGNAVLLRYLDKDFDGKDIIKTFLGTIKGGKVTGVYLEDDISAVATAFDGSALFFMVPTENGIAGYLHDRKTEKTAHVFSSTFREWLPSFAANNIIVLASKPSESVPGYAYRYHTDTKDWERFLRDKNGLTVSTAPKGMYAIYGEYRNGAHAASLWSKRGYAGDEGIVDDNIELPFATIADKCAWSSPDKGFCDGFTAPLVHNIPDAWYQGSVSLGGRFWSISAEKGETEQIGDEKLELGYTLDAFNITIFPDEEYLAFADKETGYLWALRINPYAPSAPKNEGDSRGEDR